MAVVSVKKLGKLKGGRIISTQNSVTLVLKKASSGVVYYSNGMYTKTEAGSEEAWLCLYSQWATLPVINVM